MEKILLYVPLLKWYLSYGLKVTAIHKYLKYEPGKPFEWFPEEVSQARHDGDDNSALKQLGDTFKLKGSLFCGKMIEDLVKRKRTTFTTNEDLADKSSGLLSLRPWKKFMAHLRSIDEIVRLEL